MQRPSAQNENVLSMNTFKPNIIKETQFISKARDFH